MAVSKPSIQSGETMKSVVLFLVLAAFTGEFLLASCETCEQMIDNFRLPDMQKKMKAWLREETAAGDEPDCLDEIVGMMMKGMEEEEARKRSTRSSPMNSGSPTMSFQSWHQSNSKSVSTLRSGPLSITTVDGETHYEIDGKPIDLSRATLLEDNSQEAVWSPSEVEGAKVTFHKKVNRVTLEYKNHRVDSSAGSRSAYNYFESF